MIKPIQVKYIEIREIELFKDMMKTEIYNKTVLVGHMQESYFIQGYEGIMKQIYIN